jgi:hypothetical protein
MQVLCSLWFCVQAESQPVQGAELILYAQETGAIKEVQSAQVSVESRVYLRLCACESRGLELNKNWIANLCHHKSHPHACIMHAGGEQTLSTHLL